MSTGAIDEARLEQFMGRMVGHMTGATACFSIWLGDELGLYGALAARVRAQRRRAGRGGWLSSAAGARVAGRSGGGRACRVRRRRGSVFADCGGGDGAGGRHLAGVRGARDERASGRCSWTWRSRRPRSRGDGALAWGDHHPCLFKGTEWFFRTGYRAHLPGEWIPALDGVEDKLKAGATGRGCRLRPRRLGGGDGGRVPEPRVSGVRLPRAVDRDGARPGA